MQKKLKLCVYSYTMIIKITAMSMFQSNYTCSMLPLSRIAEMFMHTRRLVTV